MARQVPGVKDQKADIHQMALIICQLGQDMGKFQRLTCEIAGPLVCLGKSSIIQTMNTD